MFWVIFTHHEIVMLGTAEKMTRPQKPSQTASRYPPPLPDSIHRTPDAHLMPSLPPVALLTAVRFVVLKLTVLAIAGEDFSIVASDTRLSEGFSIHTRDSPKCYKLTDKTVIGCSGFHGDCLTLTKIIEARLKMYKHSNNKAMTTGAIAAMLSTILYSRRFFPYYVYNIIGGLDEEGKGAVYSFDPVGSYQRDSFKAGGSASAMLQPLLDNQVGFKNMQNVEHVPLTLDRAMRLVKDVFISAAERDVYTGDALRICIVTKEGIREETVPLRKD